jgi:hypothetical protein
MRTVLSSEWTTNPCFSIHFGWLTSAKVDQQTARDVTRAWLVHSQIAQAIVGCWLCAWFGQTVDVLFGFYRQHLLHSVSTERKSVFYTLTRPCRRDKLRSLKFNLIYLFVSGLFWLFKWLGTRSRLNYCRLKKTSKRPSDQVTTRRHCQVQVSQWTDSDHNVPLL